MALRYHTYNRRQWAGAAGYWVCYAGEDLVSDPLTSDDDEFFERGIVPFRDALAMALDDRITESVSKVAILAAAFRRGVRL